MSSVDDATTGMHPFDRDTAAHEEGPGVFSATLGTRWDRLGGGPNGGYALAVCLRAVAHALPQPDPLVVSAFYLRPAVHGDAEVRVESIRAGRRVASAEAQLIQDGKERVRALCTFSSLHEATGRTAVFASPPDLPPPGECVDPLEGRSIDGVTIADRIEYRSPEAPGWWLGKPTGRPSTEMWLRFREPRDPDVMSLALIVDAAAPVVLELGEAGSTTLELTVHLRERPTPGWLACRISTRYVIDGFHEEDFEVWDSRGRLVAQARQLAALPPAALH